MGMMGFESEGDKPLFAEINVTPLVDVMLVLLIIFMVTAPFMAIDTIGVDLPKGQGAVAEGIDSPLTINIDRDGKVTVAGQSFDMEALQKFLSESPRVKSGEAIFVAADEATRHKELMLVMSAAYIAGAQKINIVMEKP